MSGLLQAQQISDPVFHYRGLDSDHGSSFLKWTADINGDGLPEIFLSLKKNHDEAVTAKQMPGWFVYIASTSGGGFTKCVGIQESGDSDDVIGVGVVPDIDPNCCFVGLVTEIGTHAIVTRQIDLPKNGVKVAYIYAYTVVGNHLKRTKLAQYNPDDGSNAIFDKYLNGGKRTVIATVQVDS